MFAGNSITNPSSYRNSGKRIKWNTTFYIHFWQAIAAHGAQERCLGSTPYHTGSVCIGLGQWLLQEPFAQTREPISRRVPQKVWVDAETKHSKWHSNSSQVTILKQHWQKESCLMIIKGKLCFWITRTYRGKKRKKKKQKKREERGKWQQQ